MGVISNLVGAVVVGVLAAIGAVTVLDWLSDNMKDSSNVVPLRRLD